MRFTKKIILLLLVVFAFMQFFRPEKNIAANDLTDSNILQMYAPSDSVNMILDKACNDCHTNNTDYPWYAEVQPFAWILNNHIQDGKKHLNFSEFGNYSLRKQYHKMEEVIEEVKEGKMPLDSYTWMHADAKLTNNEKLLLSNWAQNIMDSMKAKYPIDSLIRKK